MGHVYTNLAQQAIGCKIDCDKINLWSQYSQLSWIPLVLSVIQRSLLPYKTKTAMKIIWGFQYSSHFCPTTLLRIVLREKSGIHAS